MWFVSCISDNIQPRLNGKDARGSGRGLLQGTLQSVDLQGLGDPRKEGLLPVAPGAELHDYGL
jgi:hypothetical protein